MKSFFTVLLATAVVAIRLTEDGTETYAMPNVADTMGMADNMSGNDGSKMPPMPPMNDGEMPAWKATKKAAKKAGNKAAKKFAKKAEKK